MNDMRTNGLQFVNSSASEIDGVVNNNLLNNKNLITKIGDMTAYKHNNFLLLGASIMAYTFNEEETKALIDNRFNVNCTFYNRSNPGSALEHYEQNIDSILSEFTETEMLVILNIGGNNVTGGRPYSGLTDWEKSELIRRIDLIVLAVKNKGYDLVWNDITFRAYPTVPIVTTSDESNGSKPYNDEIWYAKSLQYSPNFCFPDGVPIVQMYETVYNDWQKILLPDGVHPTALGINILRQRFLDSIFYFNYTGLFPNRLEKIPPVDTKRYIVNIAGFTTTPSVDYSYVSYDSAEISLKSYNYFTSNIKFSTNNNFAGVTADGIFTTDNSGYLEDICYQRNKYFKASQTPKLYLNGLDNTKKYIIKISGNRQATDLRETMVTINGISKYYMTSSPDINNNYTDGVTFENLIPTNGNITINLSIKQGAYGYINGIELIEQG